MDSSDARCSCWRSVGDMNTADLKALFALGGLSIGHREGEQSATSVTHRACCGEMHGDGVCPVLTSEGPG